jgi:predicted ATPase/DNA-binding SARP family transcriptional activator
VRIGLLGPVTAGPDDMPAPGGVLLRGTLARLALDAGRSVSTEALVDALWGVEPPDTVTNALQALVARLRRALGTDVVDTVPGGYRLAVDRRDVDALRAESLVDAARGLNPAQARTLLVEATALRRGPALADVRRLPFAEAAAARLEELYATAVELSAEAARRLGEPAAELDALAALLAAEPLRESTAAVLARCLHAAGRQVEALTVLDRTRDRLADELGVDPGPDLSAARLAVLRGSPAPRSAPAPLTSFVGRTADVPRITGLLATGRLVTLTGPGGAGKTRLAREIVRARPGESRIAELAPLGGADQLASTVLDAVSTAEIVARIPVEADTTTRLLTALADRELLLVLDNCEHLVDAAAHLVQTLLERLPGLQVLATSREPLAVPGEVLHPVDALADDDAVRLFAERGAAVVPGFTVTPAVGPAVAEICRRLDGQPLPIELAAARLRTLTPEEIRRRLDDRFRLLTTGPRTVLPRHQTLRAVVDWSWDLLDEEERALARRLSVFAGGATEEAALQICGLGDPTLDVLTALVEKSLLVAAPGSPTRYRMLETIREYAAQRLDEAGERQAMEAAHTALIVELVETAEPWLRRTEQLEWVGRLRAEADDVAAVFRRAVAADDAATAHRLVAASAWFWLIRGLFTEATDRLAEIGALAGPVPLEIDARCTAYRAMVAAGAGDVTTAWTRLADAQRLAADLPAADRHPVLQLMTPMAAGFGFGDPGPLEQLAADPQADAWARAFAMFSCAQLAENEGDLDRQRADTRAAHELFSALGERWGLGMAVSSLGDLESVAGAYDAAMAAFDEAISLAAELGNDDDLPQFQAERARLLVRRGDVAAGRAELRRILGLPGRHPEHVWTLRMYLADAARGAGDLDDARAELALADPDAFSGPGAPQRRAIFAATGSAIARAAGDREAAARLLADAVAHTVESRDGPVTAVVAELAAAHAVADDPETAAVLLGVGAAQRGASDLGDPDVRATVAAVRAALGAAAADAAVARGRALPRPDGVALLQDYARGAGSGSGTAAVSASATSRA